jgi:hypothetical protein
VGYSSEYHRLRTSQGTKQAIAPYWRKYRSGKEKCTKCPLHDVCLELAWNDKRTLYYKGYFCENMEGVISVWMTVEPTPYGYRRTHDLDEKLKRIDWAREAQEKFLEAKQKWGVK